MRDPARIGQILDLLRDVWSRSPDLRLGQVIVNAVQPRDPCAEVFSVEDTVLACRLQRMLQRPHRGRGDERADGAVIQPAGRKSCTAKFTHRQGHFLAFLHLYRKLHGRSPAELDMVKHFRITPPSVHSMVVKLHQLGLITRESGAARSIRVAVPEEEIPPLEDMARLPW